MFKVESLFRAVMRNGAILLGGRVANAILGLAALGIAGRSLGLAGFGVIVLVQAFAEAVGEIAKFQSWQTVLRYGARPLADGDTANFQRVLRFTGLLDVISSAGGVAIGVVGCLVLGPWLKWPAEITPTAMLFSTSIAFMVTATPFGVLRLFDRFDLLAGQVPVASVVRLIGGVIAVVLHGGLAAFLAVWWAGTLAGFVFLVAAAWRELHRRGMLKGLDLRRGPLTAGFPGAWKFALTTNASATVAMAQEQISTLMVGGLLNPAQAGLWRVAEMFADAIASPANMVITALYPELAKLNAAGDNHGLGRLAGQVAIAFGAAGGFLLLLTMVAGRSVLVLTMGQPFAAAAPVLTWLAAALVLAMWALPLEPVLVSTGRAGASLRIRLVVAVCYVTALVPMVRRFGVAGAGAAAVGASALLATGMLLAVVQWRRDVRLPRLGAAARSTEAVS